MSEKPKTTPAELSKKASEKTPLFREEAIRHRTRALFGDVVLAAPLSTWLITGLLVVIIAGLVAFGIFGRVQIDNDSLSIWRWILGGSQ
ncbi:MAG: hypothetical protein COB92_07025 [Robiginitomaculum sp.]|nr:MAG: hypothetical protein COB92_07025 [Robiginitomaculum sp.]